MTTNFAGLLCANEREHARLRTRAGKEMSGRVVQVLNEERFCDQAPTEDYLTLLDEGERVSVLGAHDVTE